MRLKTYQLDTLATLRRFLSDARVRGAKSAYEAIVAEPEQQRRLRGFGTSYTALNGLEEIPYVCLRLPTGGGKTLLAAHSVDIAREAWVERDYPLVLWLVPTTTIRQQTVDALKDPRHPYRATLDEAFSGRVRVFDIGDFDQILPHDLKSNCCVIVGTIQTLRVSSTDGRKVYAHHEMLEPHFTRVPEKAPGLEIIEEGKRGAGTIKFSFANLLHLHQPLMIVDEAHQAVTGLSREMQQRVNPSAIIEFTATPHRNSNILHSVSAQELKDEEMIKLPVMLSEHQTWQTAVTGAIAKREELAKEASRDKDYVRPIVLFQAQNKDQEVTVDVLKAHLMEMEGIAEDRIAVATGDQRQLDGINLFDPACEIDFIITVQALKEGWDCSFAYVFCSVANIQSATDAEQLLGRVLRMPYAKRRASPMLNRAYANLTSKSFSEAANALKDRLVSMGFEESEAEDNIKPEQTDLDTGLSGRRVRPKPSVTLNIPADPATLRKAADVAPDKIRLETDDTGKASIRVSGFLSKDETDRLVKTLPPQVEAKVREDIAAYEAEHAHTASPAERGEKIVVPALMAWVQEELAFGDIDSLMEFSDWSLMDHSPKLGPEEFSIQETASTFTIDIDGEALFVQFSDQSAQLLLDIPVEGWTEQGLVLFLDRQVRDPSIGQGELIRWLSDAVRHLTGPRNIPLSALMQCKYPLARKLKDRIAAIKKEVRQGVYQRSLFAPEAKPVVSFDHGFTFGEGIFSDARMYGGKSYRFTKHFLGWDTVPAFDGKGPNGEGDEFDCAKALDSLPGLKHWVRNVSKHPQAFHLPLAGGKFYPDMVAEMQDGRLLVVEYKGEAWEQMADSDEKRAVGQLWERSSDGGCLFIMVEKKVGGLDMRGQLLAKIGA